MSNQIPECPKCGGTLISRDFEPEYEFVWREVYCEDCEWEYVEVYKFYRNETVGDCLEIDERGNIIAPDVLSV